MKRWLFIVVFLTAFFQSGNATDVNADSLCVRYNFFSSYLSPEKLYVHLDRTYYAVGETIWFKGYLRNASTLSKSVTSNYIYAELLDNDGVAVTRVKIKKDSDGFPGNLQIRDDLKSGNYTFRAYTLWQLNSAPEYMFSQKIKILGAEGPSKDVPLPGDDVDVSFYPEGGRYFAGKRSTIAFKVMDNHGRSIDTSGMLVDDMGQNLLSVSTLHDGMGLIYFIPQEGRSYSLVLSDGRKFDLPAASSGGATIGLGFLKDDILIRAISFAGSSCMLLARDSDSMLLLTEVPSDGKSHSFKMKKSFFNPGLNHFLLLDKEGHILSERLFFIYGDEKSTPRFSVDAKLPSAKRGLVNASVQLRDSTGAPVDAKVSMSVVRGSFERYVQDDDLVSYMKLSSELKGRINNPSYYFDSSISAHERSVAMDVLMMVQGWRYYDIEMLLDPSPRSFAIRYSKEYIQTIKGRIEHPTGKKKVPEKYVFSVIIPKLRIQRFMNVKRADRFYIDSLDFQEGTPMLVSVNRPGLGADYIPRWSGDVVAPPFKYAWAPGRAGVPPIEQKVPLFSDVVSVDTLKAAVVTANYGDDIFGSYSFRKDVDFKAYSNNTLIEYITMMYPSFEYDGEDMFNRNARIGGGSAFHSGSEDEEGESLDDSEGSKRGVVKLIENGSETPWWSYEQITMDQVQSLSVSKHGDSFFNADGGLVVLKLTPGGKGANNRENFLYFVPLGYQKPTAFYNPRYDLGDPHDSFDHRNTLFWSPDVDIVGGVAKVAFCDTDQMDYPFVVCIQGYTSSGQPVSKRTIIHE